MILWEHNSEKPPLMQFDAPKKAHQPTTANPRLYVSRLSSPSGPPSPPMGLQPDAGCGRPPAPGPHAAEVRPGTYTVRPPGASHAAASKVSAGASWLGDSHSRPGRPGRPVTGTPAGPPTGKDQVIAGAAAHFVRSPCPTRPTSKT